MDQAQPYTPTPAVKRKVAIGLAAVFLTRFTTIFFSNALNIAQPVMINEFEGMAWFSWYLALPALAGAISTLLFGKLSDMFGRRALLLTSMGLFIGGSALGAVSTNMGMAIAAKLIMSFGLSALPTMATAIIGDLFAPAQRAKWLGLVSIPAGIASTIAPTFGGFITQSSVGWRGLFWGVIPLILIAAGLAIVGVPGRQRENQHRVDLLGTLVMAVAATTMIIGGPWLGEPGKMGNGAILLGISLAAWVIFIFVEKKAEAPVLDLRVLFNRTFITVAGAGFLSFFGMLCVTTYSPIFAQEVMGVSPMLSGSMLTPFNMVMAFMGAPMGFLLSRTKRYKLIYMIGYGVLTVMMFVIWQFSANTPVWFFVVVMSVAGLGLGAIPTLNLLTVQFAAPKQLMGVAIGAIFFFLQLGMAIAPSVLGLAQNSADTLESGLKLVFLVGAVTMAMAFAVIATVPKISLEEIPD